MRRTSRDAIVFAGYPSMRTRGAADGFTLQAPAAVAPVGGAWLAAQAA